MKIRFACLFALMINPAFAADPFARSTINTGSTIVPGQQIRLTVDVFAPGFFTSPPDLPLFDIPNALVTLPEERAQNLVETVDGVQYSGIRRRYAIVPEKPGAFSVLPIKIDFTYTADGKPLKGSVNTVPTTFEVATANNSGTLFSARDVEIAQSFDRDPATLGSGDVLVRTIVVTAKDTQAMLIPPVDIGAPSGVKQYLKPPRIEDGISVGRGETESRRTETVSYTTDAEGGFILPPIRYTWFNLETSTETTADLPAVTLSVAAAVARRGITPELQSVQPSPFEQRRAVMGWVLLALAALAAAWWARGLPGFALERLVYLRGEIETSRWYRLRILRRTIRTAPPEMVYSALHDWSAQEGFRTLGGRISDYPDLAKEVEALERMLYSGGHHTFDRRRAARALAPVRGRQTPRNVSALPELNPSR